MTTKTFALIRHADHVTPTYFHQHWLKIHAEHARRLDFARYEQFHSTDGQLAPFAKSPYDGVAEVWFRSEAAQRAVHEDPFYAETILPDEHNFQHPTTFDAVSATLTSGDEPPTTFPLVLKGLLLLRRGPGTTDEEFDELWSRLPTICRDALPELIGCSTWRVQQAPRDGAREQAATNQEPSYDGVVELWWDWTRQSGSDDVDVSELARTLKDSAVDVDGSSSMVGYLYPIVARDAG